MNRKITLAWLAVAFLTLSACSMKAEPEILRSEKVMSVRSQELEVLRWLECEECADEEASELRPLDRPLVLGLLKRALFEGPTEARRALYRVQLTELYLQTRTDAAGDLAQQQQDLEALSGEKRFVQIYEENLLALYQKRAIVGLSELDDPVADEILSSAQSALGGFRRDVVDELIWHLLERELFQGA